MTQTELEKEAEGYCFSLGRDEHTERCFRCFEAGARWLYRRARKSNEGTQDSEKVRDLLNKMDELCYGLEELEK